MSDEQAAGNLVVGRQHGPHDEYGNQRSHECEGEHHGSAHTRSHGNQGHAGRRKPDDAEFEIDLGGERDAHAGAVIPRPGCGQSKSESVV